MEENPGGQHPAKRDSEKNKEGRKPEEKKIQENFLKGYAFPNKGSSD